MENNKVFYDVEINSATGVLSGCLSSDEFRGLASQIQSILQENRTCKVLTDSKSLQVIPVDAQRWFLKEWIPFACNSGLRHFAYIIPSDIFGRMSLEEMQKFSLRNDGIEVKAFKTIDEAKVWLKNI